MENNKNNKIELILKNTNNFLILESDNTQYFNINKLMNHFDLDNLIKKRNNLIKTLRKLKIRVRQKRNNDFLKSIKPTYKQLVKEHIKQAEKVTQLVLKIYQDGLYAPTSDNIDLQKAEEENYKLKPFFYRDAFYSRVNAIKITIDEITEELNRNNLNNVEMLAL